ncbi:MAG: peptide ABC transporter substrate-binding protein [Kofleriaceae bacterium]
MIRSVLGGSALAVAALAGCSLPEGDYFGKVPDRIDPRHFRWCNQGEPDHLDPARASSTISTPLVSALFVGLTTYGPDGNPVPSLATHWEIDDALRTFTFHLRDDARWTTGRRVTAYDVAYSALRLAHPLTAAPNADSINPIKNATAYLSRSVFVLRRAIGPYRAGDVVELASDGPAPDVAQRTSSRPLALRDLGAPEAAAYERVPAGAPVSLVMTTGGRATPPSPDGAPWAYVFRGAAQSGVYGWVPAAELDREPQGDAVLSVRGVPANRRPGDAPPGDAPPGDPGPGSVIEVRGRDVVHSTDALGIHVLDERTIAFELADPTPYFLAVTANRALRTVPIEAVSRRPLGWAVPEHIATSGPLHLVGWKRHDRLELVRSPTYWDPTEVRFDRMTAYSIDDQAATTSYYVTGGCDATATNTMPSTYLPALNGEQRGRPYKDYRVDPFLTVYFLWLQTEKLPNRHLRRALSLAIDRRAVPRFTHGNEMPTAQLTPGTPIAQLSDADLAVCGVTRDQPGFALVMETGALCYVPPPGLDYDPEAARRELALAKAELGRAWKEPLEYRYNAGSEAHKQIAEYLQASWARIGVRVELAAQEFNSMLDDTRRGNFEIVRFGGAGQVADTESEFLPLFRCGSPDNRGRYCSPEFERLMEQARTLRDRKARNAVLARAEAVVLGDAPVIPIYVYTQKHLIRPYVRDYHINLVDQPSLWRVWLDPAWDAPR